MQTVLSNFKTSESLLSVTLHSGGFTKNGDHYARVTRNTVTLENIIADIISENRGLDPYMIQHSATLLQQQILKQLRQGKCVNILDLGVLYIAMKGAIKGDKPAASDLPAFLVKFTPSQLTNEAVENLVVDKIVISDTSPQISIITNQWTSEENTSISMGKTCKITGNRLKLGGDEYFIRLYQCDEDGNIFSESDFLEIDKSKIIKNTSGELNFYTPEVLIADARYKIRISTMYLSTKQSRKTPVYTESIPLKVTE